MIVGFRTRYAVGIVKAQQPAPVVIMERECIFDSVGTHLLASTSAMRNRMLQPLTSQYRRWSKSSRRRIASSSMAKYISCRYVFEVAHESPRLLCRPVVRVPPRPPAGLGGSPGVSGLGVATGVERDAAARNPFFFHGHAQKPRSQYRPPEINNLAKQRTCRTETVRKNFPS